VFLADWMGNPEPRILEAEPSFLKMDLKSA